MDARALCQRFIFLSYVLKKHYPKKDLLKDINKLKEHYLETIDNWKTKYEDTKMLLNLRDQELLIYKRRGEKKLIDEDKDTFVEIDTDGKQKGVDTVDDDEK